MHLYLIYLEFQGQLSLSSTDEFYTFISNHCIRIIEFIFVIISKMMVESTSNLSFHSFKEEKHPEIYDNLHQRRKEKAFQKVLMIWIVLFFIIVPFLLSSINKKL